jgi:hypothetical protein
MEFEFEHDGVVWGVLVVVWGERGVVVWGERVVFVGIKQNFFPIGVSTQLPEQHW